MASVHLLVLIHGMWGNPEHVAELDRVIRETRLTESGDTEVHILLAKANERHSTYDGVDWGGERVAKEVFGEVERLETTGKKVKRFSVTGYSLGGLVARYLIGILHQSGFFHDVLPVNFNTLATPHIGLPKYASYLANVFSSIGSNLLSRTGEQFYCIDKWSATGRPLLEVMADPERIFYQALALFKHIRIYANAIHDVAVPYVTAAIETEDPFAAHASNGLQVEFSYDYDFLITSYTLPETLPPRPRVLSAAWFRSMDICLPVRPLAIPIRILQNTLFYLSLPVVIPLLVVSLSLRSRSSRARIKLLETQHDQSTSEKLVHILAQLEHNAQDVISNTVEDPVPSIEEDQLSKAQQVHYSEELPILTPLQRRLVTSLNKLPIKKELAYFDGVHDSHDIIVCRGNKRTKDGQHRGEGIIRHWAASFVL